MPPPRQAAALGMADSSAAAFAQRREAREMLAAAVREGNAKLSRVEQIKRFLIVGTPWEPGGDELTPTMKLKRRPDRREVFRGDRQALRRDARTRRHQLV